MSEKTGNEKGKPVFRSFAEAISTLTELTKLETTIETAIKNSLVPHHETRKMLRAVNVIDAESTPLMQYMKMLFERIGLGTISLTKKEIFRMEFSVSPCHICKLYRNATTKTCYLTAETLSKFFTTDLEIPSTAKEIECVNAGGTACKFLVEMQPLAVYLIALDNTDNEIVEYIFKNKNTTCEKIAEEIGQESEEIKYRCEILEKFKIIDRELNLTEIGIAYRKHTGKLQKEAKVFPPPWEDLAKLTETIANAESFAEAIAKTIQQEEEVVINEKDVINLAEEAKKSKSFAELLFKKLKEEEKEEDKK
ncbi:MAG: V4R domain-containing protein [Thermoplasmata archaeon]